MQKREQTAEAIASDLEERMGGRYPSEETMRYLKEEERKRRLRENFRDGDA